MALLPIGRVRNTLRYDKGEASFVALFIDDQRQAETVAGKLTTLLGNRKLDVLSFHETQAEMAGIISLDRLFNYLLQFLVGLVIAAGIMNTLLMSVFERQREFGVMLAIGMEPRQIVKLVLAESLLIGVAGLVLGTILTVPWYAYMSSVGIDFSRLVGENYSAGGVLVDPVLKFRLYFESGLIIGVVLFGLTLSAGLYPAYRAGRLPPVESLKQI